MFKKLNNIGDSGIVCDFGNEVNREINTSVIKLFHHVKKEVFQGNLKGILNYTPSYNKLIINFDLEKINSSKIIDFLKSLDFSKLNFSKNKKEWVIPICYDFGMDLDNISKTLKIEREEIKNIHLNTSFYIYMIGFETIGNATVTVFDDMPILCTDPWLTGSPYYGSWSHQQNIPVHMRNVGFKF